MRNELIKERRVSADLTVFYWVFTIWSSSPNLASHIKEIQGT